LLPWALNTGLIPDADFNHMTAIKKSKNKTKAPAPAAKVAIANTKKTSSPRAGSKAVVARKPVVRANKPKPVQTGITAKIDIGFGNALYIRGEGPGLSWDQGVLMTCSGSDVWNHVILDASRPVMFKLLVNDISWNLGDDLTVAVGESLVLTPEF